MGSFLTPLQVSDAVVTPPEPPQRGAGAQAQPPAQLSQDYHLFPEPPLPAPGQGLRLISDNRRNKQKNAISWGRAGSGRAVATCFPLGTMAPKEGGEGGSQGVPPGAGTTAGASARPGGQPLPHKYRLASVHTGPLATLCPGSAPCPPPSLRLVPTCSCPPFPWRLTTPVRAGVQTLLTPAPARGTCKHSCSPSWVTDRGTHARRCHSWEHRPPHPQGHTCSGA